MFVDGKPQYCKDVDSSLNYGFGANPAKTQAGVFMEMDTLILECI